jgi:hypothetical protein
VAQLWQTKLQVFTIFSDWSWFISAAPVEQSQRADDREAEICRASVSDGLQIGDAVFVAWIPDHTAVIEA